MENKKQIPEYQLTKDYKMHKQLHDEFENYHTSAMVLKHARMSLSYLDNCSLTADVKREILRIRKNAEIVYEFVNNTPAFSQSRTMREETVSNLKLMEEILNIVAHHCGVKFTEEIEVPNKIKRKEDPHLVVDVKEMLTSVKNNILTTAALTKQTRGNAPVSKRRVSRYRNQVRELFDILKSNQRTMTSEISEVVLAKFKMLEEEHNQVKEHLKKEDLVSWNSLVQKIKSLS